jgi:hypothetical protein
MPVPQVRQMVDVCAKQSAGGMKIVVNGPPYFVEDMLLSLMVFNI